MSEDVNKNIKWSSGYTPIEKNYTMKRGMGETWGDKNQPMVGINYLAANEFCQWLTTRERNAKRLPKNYVFRLPTEAEWEYVCRAGTTTDYHIPEGAGEYAIDEYAWHGGNSEEKLLLLARKNLIHGGYMICMAMCGSGVMTGMMEIICRMTSQILSGLLHLMII